MRSNSTTEANNNTNLLRENRGQWDSDIFFSSNTNNGVLHVLADKISIAMLDPCITWKPGDDPITADGIVVSLAYMNPLNTQPTGLDEASAKFHYFSGTDQSQWHTNTSSFSTLNHHSVWDGCSGARSLSNCARSLSKAFIHRLYTKKG